MGLKTVGKYLRTYTLHACPTDALGLAKLDIYSFPK